MFTVYTNGEMLNDPLDAERVITSRKLTLEMGKAGSLEFNLPPTNELYQTIRCLATPVTVEMDDRELFRGRVLEAPKDFYNIKKVYCEGDLSYLVDSRQPLKKYTGTAHGLFERLLTGHNARVDEHKKFKKGTVTIENRPVKIAGASEEITDGNGKFDYKQIAINAATGDWKTTLDLMTECLIEYCGGYLRTRKEPDGLYLDYLESYGSTATQEIAFGVNLLDYAEETPPDDIFNVLIPLGNDGLTIASVNGGSDELVDNDAVERYGGRIVYTHTFEDVTSPQTLLENGRRYMASKMNIPDTIVITAVDLHLCNPDIAEINVGDVVFVRSEPHGVCGTKTCTKIEYDLDSPENTVYTFGTPAQTLTERYRKDKAKTEDNIRSAAGGGGGGAAETVAEESEETLTEFFEEWIDINPEDPDGRISLGGLYRKVLEDRTALKNTVGIDLDAAPDDPDTPNINIYAIHDNVEGLVSSAAKIQAFVNDYKSELDLSVNYHGDLGDSWAAIALKAINNSSEIFLKADTTTMQSMNAETIASFNSELTVINSAITQVRNLVAAKVDTTSLGAEISALERIYAASVSVTGNIVAANIGASSMSIQEKAVATQEWVANSYIKLTDYTTQTIPVLTSITPASTQNITFLVAA